MRKLGMILGSLLLVLGFATETGAYGERRFAPRKPLPNRVLMRGGLPPVQYYGRPLYTTPYRTYGPVRLSRYGRYRVARTPWPVRTYAPVRGLAGPFRSGTVVRVYSSDIAARGQAYARMRRR